MLRVYHGLIWLLVQKLIWIKIIGADNCELRLGIILVNASPFFFFLSGNKLLKRRERGVFKI